MFLHINVVIERVNIFKYILKRQAIVKAVERAGDVIEFIELSRWEIGY